MRPFPRFVKLDPTIPDLSIPDLEKRIQQESSKAKWRAEIRSKGTSVSVSYIRTDTNTCNITYTMHPSSHTDEARTHASSFSSCDCGGCSKQNCGKCKMCLDMRKFGGTGKKKKKCQQRVCVAKTQKHGIQITQQDLDTLLVPSNWLNDKVCFKSLEIFFSSVFQGQ